MTGVSAESFQPRQRFIRPFVPFCGGFAANAGHCGPRAKQDRRAHSRPKDGVASLA